VIGSIERYFDVLEKRRFGGPLLTMWLNRIMPRLDPYDEMDSALIRSIIQFEEIMVREEILKSQYAFVIARKKASIVL
jgi:hypothetical protein